MTARLSATEKNLVLVLLGGEVSHPRSISSLAENKLVECGDRLTAKGRAAAYMVLATHLPSPTAKLHGELLKASAYASRGQIAPDDPPMQGWQDSPSGDGWYWVEKRPGDRPFMDGPLYLHEGNILPGNGISIPLDGRRVCKIPSRPQ